MAKRVPKSMSAEHKAALARGRAEGRIVRDYLEVVRLTKPKKGRKRTTESINKRLAIIEHALSGANAIDQLSLIQERRNMVAALQTIGVSVDTASLEGAFVKVASAYGARKGISFATWRDVGVPAETLAKAGIKR